MISAITGLIGGLLYPLFSIIFVLIDLLQGVFYGLAGIGDIGFNSKSSSYGQDFWGNNQTIGSTNDGGETSTGLIYYLLTSDLVKNLFMSIMLLALFLIIIFTAMAFIKNAYSSKQKNWQEIVGNAFKGLANFIFIPVCCLLGVWLSNILLLAINGATSTGGAVNMSRKLFVCCAYDANEYRNKTEVDGDDIKDIQKLIAECDDVKVDFDPTHKKEDVEYFANVVDTVYAQTSKDYANIHWWGSVERYYSLFNFNYLVLIVGGVFMLYVLVSVAYAMVKRMFILLMLFVISPAICAMYPLDEGSAVGNWKKEFIKYTISAYGAIAAMNLFFSILPIVENINLIYGEGAGFAIAGGLFNDIFQLLIMVSGLFVVKEFMGTLSGWIGGDNALATGSSLRTSTKGAIKKYKEGIGKTTNKVAGVFAKAKGARDAGGGFLGSLVSQSFEKVQKDFGFDKIGENTKKAYEESKEHHWDKRNAKAKADKNKDKLDSVLTDETGMSRDFYGSTLHWSINSALKKKGRLTEDEIEQMLSHKDLTDDARQMLAERIAKHQSRYGDADKFGKKDTAKSVLEDYNKGVARKAADDRVLASHEGYRETEKAYNERKDKVNAFKDAHSSYFTEDGKLKLKEYTASEMKAQEVKIDQLKSSGASAAEISRAQHALIGMQKRNDNIAEFKELEKEAEEFAQKVQSAANVFAQTIKDAAENQKAAEKADFSEFSDAIKNAINENASDSDELTARLKQLTDDMATSVGKSVKKAIDDAATRRARDSRN